MRNFPSFFLNVAAYVALSATIFGCTPNKPENVLATGKVIAMSETQMIVEGTTDVMFYPITGQYRAALSEIEVGDEVTFLGTKEIVDLGNGHTRQSSEVDAIILGDGLHLQMH